MEAIIETPIYQRVGQFINTQQYPSLNGLVNSLIKGKMEIAAYFKERDGLGNHNPLRGTVAETINIYNPLSRTTDQLYATTIHELAHASHWNMGPFPYIGTEKRVIESWARGVQWDLTRMIYPNYEGGGTVRPEYTQVVVDMIDTPADRNEGSELLSQDDVTGYTIRQIEDALEGQKTWNGWRDNIINRYNNATEGNLPALFAHWN